MLEKLSTVILGGSFLGTLLVYRFLVWTAVLAFLNLFAGSSGANVLRAAVVCAIGSVIWSVVGGFVQARTE